MAGEEETTAARGEFKHADGSGAVDFESWAGAVGTAGFSPFRSIRDRNLTSAGFGMEFAVTDVAILPFLNLRKAFVFAAFRAATLRELLAAPFEVAGDRVLRVRFETAAWSFGLTMLAVFRAPFALRGALARARRFLVLPGASAPARLRADLATDGLLDFAAGDFPIFALDFLRAAIVTLS